MIYLRKGQPSDSIPCIFYMYLYPQRTGMDNQLIILFVTFTCTYILSDQFSLIDEDIIMLLLSANPGFVNHYLGCTILCDLRNSTGVAGGARAGDSVWLICK